MAWFRKYWNSSIGKKQFMALTGISLVGFLLVHLLGNTSLFIGNEYERAYKFEGVAALYKSLGFMLYAMEAGLIGLFGIHIYNAFRTWTENREARKEGYEVNKGTFRVGDKGLPSFTMIISGIYLAAFLVVHVITFKYGAEFDMIRRGAMKAFAGAPLYGTVKYLFSQWWYTLFYLGGMFLIGFHLWHGVPSFFQTLGINHSKYNSIINLIGRALAILIGGGNALIAIVMFVRSI